MRAGLEVRTRAAGESPKSNEVVVVGHPVVQHKLTFLRMKDTSTRLFRDLLGEIGMLLAYELTRDLPLERCAIEIPLGSAESVVLGGRRPVWAVGSLLYRFCVLWCARPCLAVLSGDESKVGVEQRRVERSGPW